MERVQLGVRMEKRLVQVLKGLAELEEITLGGLLEKIVLHSFEPVPGDEGESCASPHSRHQLEAIAHLRAVYGLGHDVHAPRVVSSAEPPAGGMADSAESADEAS